MVSIQRNDPLVITMESLTESARQVMHGKHARAHCHQEEDQENGNHQGQVVVDRHKAEYSAVEW